MTNNIPLSFSINVLLNLVHISPPDTIRCLIDIEFYIPGPQTYQTHIPNLFRGQTNVNLNKFVR